jgi:hypothetical protein
VFKVRIGRHRRSRTSTRVFGALLVGFDILTMAMAGFWPVTRSEVHAGF